MGYLSNRSQEGSCKLCGIYRQRLQRDHITPKYKGGSNDISNIQFICANCHEDKTRIEMSEANKGRKHSKETKSKISRANMGHPVSVETRKYLSETSTAAMTSDMRAHLSRVHIQMGQVPGYIHPLKGYKHSDDNRRKISLAVKQAIARQGHPWTGRTHTEISKEKMRISKLTKRMDIANVSF